MCYTGLSQDPKTLNLSISLIHPGSLEIVQEVHSGDQEHRLWSHTANRESRNFGPQPLLLRIKLNGSLKFSEQYLVHSKCHKSFSIILLGLDSTLTNVI